MSYHAFIIDELTLRFIALSSVIRIFDDVEIDLTGVESFGRIRRLRSKTAFVPGAGVGVSAPCDVGNGASCLSDWLQ